MHSELFPQKPKSLISSTALSFKYSITFNFVLIGWESYLRIFVSVVVRVHVGKEFPDMRQNEREIKFIRMRDTVRTVGQLKGELRLNRGP